MSKYPKITGYWVYVHRTPDGMCYVGISQQKPYERWKTKDYKTISLKPYIDHYGWDNIEHLVVTDGLTKEQAAYWEERLRQMYTEMGCCINKNHSGNCTADIKQYQRKYQQEYRQQEVRKEYYRKYKQRPEVKERQLKYQQTPEGRIYNRVDGYNRRHPNKATETPLEAKKKYLEYGYIPNYIKSDDLA